MQFGPYTVERAVEQRDGLTVYAAKHDTTGDAVLLTVYKPDSLDSAYRWTERLNALQRLQHRGIVTPVEVSRTMDGVPFVMTPLIVPLLGRDKVLSPRHTTDVTKQISDALDFAHSHNITHGMLRPAHIGMIDDDHFVVRGFELAGGDTMPHDPSQDISALGQFVQRALTGKTPPAGQISKLLPPGIAAVIARSQNLDGFSSASEFHEALQSAIDHLPVMQRVSPLVGQPDALRRKGRGRGVLVALLLLVMLVGGGFLVWQYLNGGLAPLLPAQAVILPTVGVLPTSTLTPLPELAADLPLAPATNTPASAIESPTAASLHTDTPITTTAVIGTAASPLPTTATLPPTVSGTVGTPLGAITATPFFIPSNTPAPVTAATVTPFVQVPSEIPADSTIDTSGPDGPTAIPSAPKPCISMVGDSVTHGGVTYNIPDTGYIIGFTKPVADFVNDKLREQGINDLIAYDRGVSNTGINTANHPSYFRSAAYGLLLDDHCKFTILMPWLNDITPDRIPQADAAPQHVRAIIALARKLVERNPAGRIIVLNYYQGAVAPFAAATWATGFTAENRDLYNREIKLSCDIGSLSKIPQVTCFNTDDAFQALGTDYVIGMATRQQVMADLIAPLGDIQQGWLDSYEAANPGGPLEGDGIHLSNAGKDALSTYIVQITRTLADLPFPAPDTGS